mgnify:FL=1
MSYIGRGLQAGAFRQLDDISSGFDGSDATHTMQVNSADVTVGDVNQILLSLGGVIQKPGTDFTVASSVITFTTAPAANTSFFAILLGSDNGGTVTPTDASVTAGKLATTVLTGQTDIGAAIVDADLFLVDDGAGGTLRKVAASRIKTYAGASSAFTEAVTITTADNLDTLTLTSTDADANAGPILKIQRDSANPADNDLVGSIRFSADNDAGEQTNILQTNCFITDVSDGTEDFQFEIDGMIAGTQRNFITMYGAGIIFNEDSQDIDFRVESNGNSNMLFVDGGNDVVTFGTTAASPGYSNNTAGVSIKSTGALYASATNTFHSFNRSNDGTVIAFSSAGGQEGLISISGGTTSYAAFTGSHWSRLADNSKPTILRGTIIESLDTMMDWYYAEADGDIKAAITLPNGKSVGDSVTFTADGVEHTGVYKKEDDIKHVKSKISDTADSTKVYGVFSSWDDSDDGLDNDVNDFYVAQVGTYIIRVHKDITVAAGDLLVSNGDGTAKKQDDDIIRSKTIAKVNSNVKVETYDDGSYTVPCTLHC